MLDSVDRPRGSLTATLSMSWLCSSVALVAPTSCTGFTNCVGEPNNDTLGPIEIEVVP